MANEVAKRVVMADKDFEVKEHAGSYLKAVLVFDPDTRKWVREEQPLTEQAFNTAINAGVLEMLSQILTELRVHTYYLKQGLNVKDEPEVIRNESSIIS